MSAVTEPDPAIHIDRYLAQYHSSLHLHRALLVAQKLIFNPATPVPSIQSYGHVANALLAQLKTSCLNADLYREVHSALFERGFDVTNAADVTRQIEVSGAQLVEHLQEEIAKAQHAVDGSGGNSVQLREVLVSQLVKLGNVYLDRGDVQRGAKMFAQARSEAHDQDGPRIHYLQAQILSLFRSWNPSVNPQGAFTYLGSLEKLVAVPTLLRGAINAARSSDANYIFFVVSTALCELDKKNYRGVADVLKSLNRYPAAAAASLQPQIAVEYTHIAAAYISHLPKLVQDTQLTTLRDLVRIATLSLFATHTRADAQAVVGLGYLKGWLEEDHALNVFVENMIACQYRQALKDLEYLLRQTSFQYELHSSASPGSLISFAPSSILQSKAKSVSHQDRWLQLIRESALEQYTTPYVTLSLPSMAQAFGISVPQLERELRSLIESGKLNCRIDTAAQLLRHKETDARLATFKALTEVGKRTVHERLMVARVQSLERNEVVQKAIFEAKRREKLTGLNLVADLY
ncbi:Hypothetical protein, putative [Bodo saltans]|uniref:PCI domain-containing protein n=1 Tax=Bodo saltans TaxID=75058 RepID=A0A0S4II25_BODSA|nr:Hypothetical protein, putative [Bodo saltans]|eukprot:CUE70239.1 Hypothetical protein, putative [Bodo saltans]